MASTTVDANGAPNAPTASTTSTTEDANAAPNAQTPATTEEATARGNVLTSPMTCELTVAPNILVRSTTEESVSEIKDVPTDTTTVACSEQALATRGVAVSSDLFVAKEIDVSTDVMRPLAVEGWGRDALMVEGIFRIIENMEPPWITLNALETAALQFPGPDYALGRVRTAKETHLWNWIWTMRIDIVIPTKSDYGVIPFIEINYTLRDWCRINLLRGNS